jgi:hypothetical protein
MNKQDQQIAPLREFYLKGDFRGALEYLSAHPDVIHQFPEALQLVHYIRTEVNQSKINLLLQNQVTEIDRNTASCHQMLVLKLLENPIYSDPRRLESFGYSVGSQNDEDGIIIEIFRRIGTTNKQFFEFGVGNGLQNNTVNLLLSGWRGTWIEVNQKKFRFIKEKFAAFIALDRLSVFDTPITPDNINEISERVGLHKDFDLLSIDIDGNDYYVFKELAFRPRVVVVEYNGLFPPPQRILQSYNPDYEYNRDTYVGASLQSLIDLALEKGYRLVGTNLCGLNAFFVREDCYTSLHFSDLPADRLYNKPRLQLAWGKSFGLSPPLAISPLSDLTSD